MPSVIFATAAVAATLLLADSASAQAFIGNNLGQGNGRAGATRRRPNSFNGRGAVINDGTVATQELFRVDLYTRTCECKDIGTPETADIRLISDAFASSGDSDNSFGLTNMVWGVGQFLDHDMALSIEDEESDFSYVETELSEMGLHDAVFQQSGRCKNTVNAQTPLLDASQVYGVSKQFLERVLQEPQSCKLRTEAGTFPPITTEANEDGVFFFVTGDIRVSEQAFLATQHIIWIREHNRLCDVIAANPSTSRLNWRKQFDLARAVLTAKWQRVVLEEFLPALGITQAELQAAAPVLQSPSISVEFSIGFRLGHDLIGDVVGDVGIVEAFNAEAFFTDAGGTPDEPTVSLKPDAESRFTRIVRGLSTTPCKEFDGRMSDALRNALFGAAAGEDLAGRNIFRGRQIGVPQYGELAQCFGIFPDANTQATTPDAWLGLLREPKTLGSPLGPTLRAMMVDQFARTVFGPQGFFWANDISALGPFLAEVQSSTYAQIIAANTDFPATGNVFRL